MKLDYRTHRAIIAAFHHRTNRNERKADKITIACAVDEGAWSEVAAVLIVRQLRRWRVSAELHIRDDEADATYAIDALKKEYPTMD